MVHLNKICEVVNTNYSDEVKLFILPNVGEYTFYNLLAFFIVKWKHLYSFIPEYEINFINSSLPNTSFR